MKKLLVVASAVVLACSVNAAQYVWGIINEGDYVNKNGDAFDAGTAFLYLGTVTASESAFDLSSATYVTSAGYVDDYFGTQDTSSMPSSDVITSTTAGQAFSLLLFDKEGMTASDLASYSGDYLLYTGTSSEGVLPGIENTKYAVLQRVAEVGASDWATMGPVPEPTSGLLLLLGMASLALKRKRA